ncbi:hypothetical protein MNEG_0944 [Monoraphidium neglectum]|uniref:Protein ENHANCED DISEASE RESISTANCE 2 C-terminal domain-containing protein n=1 Tax=Monoraphidium neglectum TaxID=145388 RepID=A0A0D2LKS4_9CHLO|nr:hypothetical protein MNEG_0944 [Monoraphidium neglectum]KIZ06999.1 hypothetical protein MNEG_0944 [Monoraphidium neglectum]|eukprot:XP_013906018.1 hypothetical protein MNEG_0944 [Monoraphidium neglectum]
MVGDTPLPPLLVFNVQMPQYPAAFWGASDGPGQSIVYYFALPEDFDPETFQNRAALGLLQRFVSNGRESDGSPTRERLKMIVRCCNAEEWAAAAPLNSAEYKLLVNYNEKPVLTRPQHFFYVGPNYLEVDMDVHSYAYLARKALNSYHSRLKSVVWENAFVLQGNASEELPEQVLGCGRIYRTDFEGARALNDLGAVSEVHSRAPSALAPESLAFGSAGTSRVASPPAEPAAADAADAAGARLAAAAAGGGSGGDGGGASAAVAVAAAAGVTAARLAAAAEAGVKAAPVAVVAEAGG